MTAHVVNLIRTANFELRRINAIWHYLSVQATQTLVSAFVLSRLDYCNSHLSGCPQCLLNRLQKVQNNAALLILKAPKTDHITPHLCTLHWLPIDATIKYKLCSPCLVLSTFPIFSRFTPPLGYSDFLQTSIYCAFHLLTLSQTLFLLHRSNTLEHTSKRHQVFSVSFFL